MLIHVALDSLSLFSSCCTVTLMFSVFTVPLKYQYHLFQYHRQTYVACPVLLYKYKEWSRVDNNLLLYCKPLPLLTFPVIITAINVFIRVDLAVGLSVNYTKTTEWISTHQKNNKKN